MPFFNSASFNIYEENSIFSLEENQKSEYSYSQNHWFPEALTVKSALGHSSSKYNKVRDGRAIWIKIIPGISVQTHSKAWLSNNLLLIK